MHPFTQSDSLRRPANFIGRQPETSGLTWSFRNRREAEPEILSMAGVDRVCLRSAKMARLEAVLVVSEGAISTRKLATLATLADPSEAKALIEQLNNAYDRAGSAFRIERVATGYQLLTRPAFAHWLGKLHQREIQLKLTPPAMETLTIIAYRQPITRADLEVIRGVQSAEMLKMLMERSLVKIGGEDDSLGRPYLYETTRKFLETFGLRSLDDLPMADQLRKPRAMQLKPAEIDDDPSTSAA